MGVEVVKDLAPHAIDRTVTLVDDDDVEGLGRNGRVVDNLEVRDVECVLTAGLVELVIEALFSTQDRIEALDGADDHPS